MRRVGFMAGQVAVPGDIDTMGSFEIERLSKAVREAASRDAFFGLPENLGGCRHCTEADQGCRQ
jgi:hypothetical protein